MSFVELPPEVSLSDPAFEAEYARVSYTAANGHTFRGGLIYYTAAVLEAAEHPAAAAKLVEFLLSDEVRAGLLAAGFELPPSMGDPSPGAL
jgi:ABC-type Fe3+ transport system substrate-binding protein